MSSLALGFSVPQWSLGATTREVASGVGQEALDIRRALSNLDRHAQKPITLGAQTQLLNEIKSLKSECNERCWDGYDAEPISLEAAQSSMHFVQQLPDGIALPKITPENTGSISFDWLYDDNLILSVSVSSRKIVYAGIIDSQKVHGETPFIRDIPKNVIDILTSYFIKVD